MRLPRLYEELLSLAPVSAGERARRWAATRRAFGSVAPHLAVAGIPTLKPRDLRAAFAALDLHYFQAAYRSCFDNEDDTRFAWHIANDDAGGDILLQHHMSGSEQQFEFTLYRPRLARTIDGSLSDVATFDRMTATDVLDVILILLVRSMLHVLAILDAPSPDDVEPTLAMLNERIVPFGAPVAGGGETREVHGGR